MYLYHILHRSKNELIRKVYEAQKIDTVNDDWVQTVEKDMKELNIDIKDLNNLKKGKFKKKLKGKIVEFSFKYLKNIAKSQSKASLVSYKKLQVQNYLVSSKFSNKQKMILTGLRTRMIDVKDNFKNKYQSNLNCDLCGEY